MAKYAPIKNRILPHEGIVTGLIPGASWLRTSFVPQADSGTAFADRTTEGAGCATEPWLGWVDTVTEDASAYD
jgi:hypothetical protein